MQTLDLVRSNLLSPVVLAFLLGAIAVFVRSDLSMPKDLYAGLSIYLLLAIGLRGGHELAEAHLSEVWRPALATLALGVVVPLMCYALLRRTGRFNVADAAALAAHYGSVSAVTFAATLTFLDTRGIQYEGFMPALVALLEVPAIVVALMIARIAIAKTEAGGASSGNWKAVLHEVLAGRSVVLMIGGLIAGYVSTSKNMDRVAPVFVNLFYGALVLFLLEMGMVAARRLREALSGRSDPSDLGPTPLPAPAELEPADSGNAIQRRTGWFLLAFAILMPVFNGALGVALGKLAGMSFGGAVVLGVMSASASYIAAPAAVRVALPQANPAYYLTAAIGITFPFNLTLGIPIMYSLAQLLYRG